MKPVMTHIALHVNNIERCRKFYQDYCQLAVVNERLEHGKTVLWLAEEGKEKTFILVLIPGGPGRKQSDNDYSHLGFALASREAVDAIADKAKTENCLWWPPQDHPYPVGYYCGVKDPDGNAVEFSYGQPLGPGSDKIEL